MIIRNDLLLWFKKTNISVVRYDGEMHVKNIMKFFILIRFFSFVMLLKEKCILILEMLEKKKKLLSLLILNIKIKL